MKKSVVDRIDAFEVAETLIQAADEAAAVAHPHKQVHEPVERNQEPSRYSPNPAGMPRDDPEPPVPFCHRLEHGKRRLWLDSSHDVLRGQTCRTKRRRDKVGTPSCFTNSIDPLLPRSTVSHGDAHLERVEVREATFPLVLQANGARLDA